MKKLFTILLACILLLLTMPCAFAAGTVQIAADDVTASAGETFQMKISLKSNPGIISMLIKVKYDKSALTLKKAENGSVFPASCATFGRSYDASPYTVLWNDALSTTNNKKTGTLVTLTFQVSQNVSVSKTTVQLLVDQGNVFDTDIHEVPFTVKDGVVTIKGASGQRGDVNGDGLINSADAQWILQYAVGSRTLTAAQKKLADVTGDGKINSSDALKILQYSVGKISSL